MPIPGNAEPMAFSGQQQEQEHQSINLNIELSLGPKEPVSPALVHQSNAAIPRKSDKSDPSFLSLTLQEENRWNWDLNTTMDVWGEGSDNSDSFAHRHADIGGSKKNNSCHDEKSSLTTASSVGLSFNKGKHVLDDQKSDSSNVSKQPIQQYKIDDSVGLRLAVPYRELNLQQAQISAMNVNGTLKRDSADEKKLDSSIGSSSSSNMEKEFVNNQETVSSSALPGPLKPQNSSGASICSELTTSGDLSNQSEHSFRSKELYDPNDIPNEQIASIVFKSGELQLKPSKVGNSRRVVSVNKCKLARVDEHITELCKSSELAANDGEKMNLSVETEDSFGSDCETLGNRGVDNPMHVEENVCPKEDEEYEDGEIREPLQHSAGEDTIVKGKKTENLKLVESDSVMLGDQNISSDLNRGEDAVKENRDNPNKDCVGTSSESLSEDNSLQKVSEEVLEVGVDNKSSINVSPAKKLDPDAAKDVEESHLKEVLILSRATAVTSPCKTRTMPSKLLTSRRGKERYPDADGSRDEIYNCGDSNKFVKDRNSRPTFMVGRGRISGRFGSMRGEWDSDHDFASENNSYGLSDYRVRRKHTSSIPDDELRCNDGGIPQDGTSLGSNRRGVNDEFPNLRHSSVRRLSPGGERDGTVTRNNRIFRRIPRIMSANRCKVEDDSKMIGLRHNDKFMRHISDDMMDPIDNHPQAMHGELEGQQVMRGIRYSFRNGYNHNPITRSKSPVRSRTRSRSRGPRSSPRRRSSNGLHELNQHRSPSMYRMGRVRSPDRACFRDEMVSRRRGSPSYVSRHVPDDLRDSDSVRPSSGNSNRRGGGSPGRFFPRSGRKGDGLDSREMGDADERRKFFGRGGPPIRSFRRNYGNEGENFRFHMNAGSRPYRFCRDQDAEFVERSKMRERVFDGRIKHQSFGSRRIRDIEEQQDRKYRPDERVWDDGFNDDRVKRKRLEVTPS